MELVGVLRILARHRLLVVAGLVVSLIGAGAMFKLTDKTTTSAISWGRALMTTPRSTASDIDPRVAETLPERTTLLADLMTTLTARQDIARSAGVPIAQLGIRSPAMGVAQVAIPLPVAAEQAGLPHATYVADVTPAAGGQVPIIGVTVTGPSTVVADRIVDGLIGEMRSVGNSQRGHAVIVEPLGRPTARIFSHGARKSTAALLALGVFGLWCSVIVVVSGLARRSRVQRQHRRQSRSSLTTPA